MYQADISQDGSVLTLSGAGDSKRFHAVWLRDNSWDEQTRSKGNGQRLIALRDIAPDIRIIEARTEADSLYLTFAPGDEKIEFSLPWLLEHAYDGRDPQEVPQWARPRPQLWDAALQKSVPCADFEHVKKDARALRDWLRAIEIYGFAKLENGPVRDQALMEVADLFGHVRETNYGRHFEVRTEINPVNLAYTGLGLQAHTDNPYRDPVPTVQILYCLESSAKGGENMVVDGFKAAETLRAENPDWFDALSRHPARFEYAGESGVVLRARRAMIELDAAGEISCIRFNNRSAAALCDVPFDKMPLYYEAYRRFGEIIDDPANEVTFRLEPGDCFLVNNMRVLHARKAYSGTGTRHLQGCYADMDGLHSTRAALERQLESPQ